MRHRRAPHRSDLRADDRRHRRAGAAKRRRGVGSRRGQGHPRAAHPGRCSSTWRRSAAGPEVCFVEPKYAGNGPDEQALLARYLHERHGLTVMHADPSELDLRKGAVWYQDQRVDLAYRDYGVVDLLELEAEGVDVEPMRVLLRENRVMSSIAADLDQKACWEVLTDPRLCHAAFHTGRAAGVPAPHPVDARADATVARCCPTASRASCSTTRAPTTRRWCSSRIAPTAARGS